MKAKSIMIQGTGSSVGKSVITAGLCRVFMQDGYQVAPFKSQNMALNSFITKEGKEMGRAQVVQAEAAGIEPSVEMNPILLKPTTDKKSQVIINGEVYKNMSAVEYHAFKPELAAMVKETYEKLAAKNHIVVIEGAGSPAEINLRDKDIVNMGMAEIADAPVILVGDIDKGGVFASLAGTMLLLTEDERRRVKGVIINKFRGDVDILKPGLKMLEDIIHVPVLGVLPYTKLDIEDEDSLAEKFIRIQKGNTGDVDVAVVRLPHISNFTDFNALEHIHGVKVRYVEQLSELLEPDMILLPGTKNTLGDLMHIRHNGIEAEIKRLNEKGTVVFGICGGYQMLGMEIHDPYKTESYLLKADGMRLLNTKTVFQTQKVTTQTQAVVSGAEGMLQGLEGMKIEGYEIHMGNTEYMEGCVPYLIGSDAEQECDGTTTWHETDRLSEQTAGVRNEAGTVFGTYIHGIFDNMEFSSGLINNLKKGKAMAKRAEQLEGDKTNEALSKKRAADGAFPVYSTASSMPLADGEGIRYKSFKEFKEQQYDKLAEMLRENLDMSKIYEIVGLNV